MKKRYEVQTKFIYGWENVWKNEEDKLVYFKTKKSAMKELKDHVKDWNNSPHAENKYSYDDFRVIYTDKYDHTFFVFKNLQKKLSKSKEESKQIERTQDEI